MRATSQVYQRADAAEGIVIELRARDSSDGHDTYAAVVEYRDQHGKTSTFVDSVSSSPPYYRKGDTVPVLYNRKDPDQAQIDRGLLNFWVSALFGSMGVLFLLMGLYSARKRFR